MPDQLRHAERAAGVARRRLNPDVLERPVAQNLAVADAVERHAAGHDEVLRLRQRMQVPRALEHHLLAHDLHRRRQIHLALRDRRLRIARRPAEEPVELLARHRHARRSS